MNKYQNIIDLLHDLVDMEEAKLPIWTTAETRRKVLEETKAEYQVRKQMIIDTLQKLQFGDLTKE